MSKMRLLVGVFALFLAFASRSFAQTNWTGGNTGVGDDNWNTLANWDNGVPTASVLARLGFGTTPGTSTIDATTGSAAAGSLIISNAATGAGTLLMNDGTFTVGTLMVGGNGAASAGGEGTFRLSGGSVLMNNGTLSLGFGNGTAANGTLVMGNGSTFSIGGTSTIVFARTGNAAMIMNGGLFSLSGGTFQVARSSGSTAITINDGTLNHGTAGMFETFANTTTATVAMNGGTLTGAGSYTISRSGGVASLQMSNGYFKNTNNTGVIIVNNTTAGSAGSLLVGGGTFLANTLNVNIGNTGAATLILSQNNVNVPTEMSLGRITQTGGSAYVHFDGGTLTVGSVSVDGPVFQGGTLSPGTAGAAGGGSGFGTTNFTATIAVNYIQGANSHLHLDLGSNPTNDPNTANRDYVHILTVTTGTNHLGETGNATLNGVIDVDITDPVYNTLYTVLTVDAATAGTGGVLTDNSTVVSHTDGWTFNKVYTDGGRTLQLQVIPEPATLGIAGIAFISLLHRRPRRARRRPFATAAA